jgi:hypothetical protein
MSRKLKLTIEPISGAHNYFIVKVDDKIVLHGEAKKMEYEADIPDKPTSIYTSSLGVGSGPQYKVTIDLPGNTNDHSNIYTLNKGYHEITYIL